MLALVSFDGNFDLPQHLFTGFADCCSEDTHGGGGVEIKDGLEIRVGEIVGGIKSTAAHQHIGGADSSGMFENSSQVVFIISFEKRTVNDAAEVPLVLLPPALDQFSGDGLQLDSKTGAAGNAKALLQRVSEFVDIIAQRPGIERRFGVGRGDLDEDLVFQSDVAERQLTLDTRARQQLGHVLLIAQLRAEKNEYQRTERQQNI